MPIEVKLFSFPFTVDNRNLHRPEVLEGSGQSLTVSDTIEVTDGKVPIPNVGFVGFGRDKNFGVFISHIRKVPNERDSSPAVIEQIGPGETHPIYLPAGKNRSRVYGTATFK